MLVLSLCSNESATLPNIERDNNPLTATGTTPMQAACSPGVHVADADRARARRQNKAVDHSAHFSLIEDGHGHWIIRHQITDVFAGTILRTTAGYSLRNESGRTVGNFITIDDALDGLYARV